MYSEWSDYHLNQPKVLRHLNVPKVMYHLAPRDRVDSIQANGLVVGSPTTSQDNLSVIRGVYLTSNPKSDVGGDLSAGNMVVVEVSTEGLDLRLDPEFFYADSAEDAEGYVAEINKAPRRGGWAMYSQVNIPPSHVKVTKQTGATWKPPKGKWLAIEGGSTEEGRLMDWVNEFGVTLSVDATGHQHKGKGEGGGQFAKGGGDAQPTAKELSDQAFTAGMRAESERTQQAHEEAAEAYRAAAEAHLREGDKKRAKSATSAAENHEAKVAWHKGQSAQSSGTPTKAPEEAAPPEVGSPTDKEIGNAQAPAARQAAAKATGLGGWSSLEELGKHIVNEPGKYVVVRSGAINKDTPNFFASEVGTSEAYGATEGRETNLWVLDPEKVFDFRSPTNRLGVNGYDLEEKIDEENGGGGLETFSDPPEWFLKLLKKHGYSGFTNGSWVRTEDDSAVKGKKEPPSADSAPAPEPASAERIARNFRKFTTNGGSGEDIIDFEEAKPFLGTKQAPYAALQAFVTGAYTEINTQPDHPVSKAMMRLVRALPDTKIPSLMRAMNFPSDRERDAFLKQLGRPGSTYTQDRTFASWNDAELGAEEDITAQYGDSRVVLTLQNPVGAKDISQVCGGGTGAEVLTKTGDRQRIVSVEKRGGVVHVTLESVGGTSLSTDATGRQHKGKGKGGGQFSKSDSGSDTTQPDAYTRVPNPSSTLAAAYKAIDSNEDLSDEQRDQYAAAFEQVCSNIPDSAHALIEDGLKKGGIRLYADPFKVMDGMWEEIEAQIQKNKPMWLKILDFIFDPKSVREAEKMARRNSTFMAPAAFSSDTGGLHLDGGDLAEAPDLFGKDTHAQVLPHLYAHELTHAIDLNGRFSNTPEWQEAWQEEIADGGLLTEYGKTLLVEGFAEMGRAVYGGGTDLAEVERLMPKCSKFFKDNGLWPTV